MTDVILRIVVQLVLLQAVPIGSGLTDGVHLVYESGGVEQAPWIYDSVRVVDRDGFDRCVIVTRRSLAPRESCSRADTLFEAGSAGAYVATRPLGPHMTLIVRAASGNAMVYTTGDATTRSVSGHADVQVIPTVILTQDSTGATIRRLREDYAPSLLTAVWGVFETPDDDGGWSLVREFSLVRLDG